MKTLKKQQQRFKEIGVAKHHRGLGNLILRYGSQRTLGTGWLLKMISVERGLGAVCGAELKNDWEMKNRDISGQGDAAVDKGAV